MGACVYFVWCLVGDAQFCALDVSRLEEESKVSSETELGI